MRVCLKEDSLNYDECSSNDVEAIQTKGGYGQTFSERYMRLDCMGSALWEETGCEYFAFSYHNTSQLT